MKKSIYRWAFYIAGILILAVGLTLNTKSALGVSPIISVSYLFAEITGISFGDTTFVYYCLFVLVQLCMLKDWKILLQIPFSIVFTRFLNLFSAFFAFEPVSFVHKFIVLIIAIVCTGIGAALTVNMQIIPNPGDGIVNAIALKTNKEMGLIKNIFDCCCICITLVLGFLTGHAFCGIGIGTICAMIGVGRVIAVFNQFCKKTIQSKAGL